MRLLVSNTAAGCIIGKGGATINEFQSESGARIQLSRSHEFFPGTSDRIILISGFYDDIMKAIELILRKLIDEVDYIFWLLPVLCDNVSVNYHCPFISVIF